MNELPRRTILLVDDEPTVRETMAMLLRGAGYDVTTAVHGLDALAQLKLTVPDIVISDLNMPEMSGFDLIPLMRQNFPSIPIVAMSGVYPLNDRSPSEVAADRFYTKGQCRPEELLRIAAELIHA
jgi:CheY-like chemotaxis protein